jgi:hypothetical protein
LANEFKKTLQDWGITKPIHIGTTAVDQSLLDEFVLEEKFKRFHRSSSINVLFLARLERAKGAFETVDAVSLLL